MRSLMGAINTFNLICLFAGFSEIDAARQCLIAGAQHSDHKHCQPFDSEGHGAELAIEYMCVAGRQGATVLSMLKPISQLRFDCDTTTTRLRRKIDMFIFCSRRIASNGEAGARDTS